ncbi:hypothetical protein F4802DRAFT_489711 [Xylaria palmicola]|nr:hypothetical protein F4802DRAFT_489711 [Xylaria palmicola]
MSSSFHRVYVRFGGVNCVRFFAPGDGLVVTDGLQLFEWIRDPRHIASLRNNLQYIYEVDQKELQAFLEFKLLEDRAYLKTQMEKYPEGSDMVAAFRRKHGQFCSLRTATDMLEAISNTTEVTAIPRVSPRKRSDQPGWLYLLDLNQETLEVYEFKDLKPNELSPFARLTIKSLYRASPNKPPGYYIKLKLSELQAMQPSEWVKLHKSHARALERLWKQNATVLLTIPHADTIPFAVLYGSACIEQYGNIIYSGVQNRLTQASLVDVVATLNRRQPSKMRIFKNEANHHRSGVDHHLHRLQARIFGVEGQKRLELLRRRINKR